MNTTEHMVKNRHTQPQGGTNTYMNSEGEPGGAQRRQREGERQTDAATKTGNKYAGKKETGQI